MPEQFSPAAYVPVGQSNETITIVANWRGTLFVSTNVQWYLIQGGASPFAVPTGSKHGGIASKGWTLVESGIANRANDGLRQFNGANNEYMTLIIQLLYRTNP